ncbi:MAG TPA: stage III sporulation protein SpoAB, partial [Syntrophomonadaceae bacterium]|nr:stage III sporulation protein SpoAB [Syntrophomonadaceae bacterium]
MNTVKLMGIIFIIAGLGSYGLMEANGLKLRVRQIKELKMALGFLEKEITYLQTPLSLALSRTANCTPG